MSQEGFEFTIPVFEWEKTADALYRAATVIGSEVYNRINRSAETIAHRLKAVATVRIDKRIAQFHTLGFLHWVRDTKKHQNQSLEGKFHVQK
jgi:hypothetical protein